METERIDLWLDCDPGIVLSSSLQSTMPALANALNRTRCKSTLNGYFQEGFRHHELYNTTHMDVQLVALCFHVTSP